MTTKTKGYLSGDFETQAQKPNADPPSAPYVPRNSTINGTVAQALKASGLDLNALRHQAHRRLDEIMDHAEADAASGSFGVWVDFSDGRIKSVRRSYNAYDRSAG